MLRWLSPLLACVALTGCGPKPPIFREATLPHPSTRDAIGLAQIGDLDFSLTLVELTDESVCVEFRDRRMFDESESDTARLRAARVELVVEGEAPRPAALTVADSSKGAQFCAPNDFIDADTPSLGVNVLYERLDLRATFTFTGGKPRTGAWGGRGRTEFPTAEESRARADSAERAKSQSRARIAKIIEQLAKAGYRCGKVPESGMLKVACDVGDGDVELWSTDEAGTAFELISKWEARSSDQQFCSRKKSEIERIESSLRVSGDLRCSALVFRYVDTINYSEDERWVARLERHLKDGDQVARELDRRGYVR